jgi:glycosyltransferase involved in cell wall biosynthesis
MKIEVFALCYNEEILLPFFLRHYARFADRIHIYDNYSTDRSPEICRAHPKVGLVQWESGSQIRDDLYLEIKNNCWKNSDADWVIICDMDEFLVGLFPDWLQKIDNQGITVISADWWEMFSETIPDSNSERQIYELIDLGVNLGQATKSVIFKPGKIREIGYNPGCHSFNPQGEINLLRTGDMKILHYKHISLQYVLERNALFASRLSNINIEKNWGFHYKFAPEKVEAWFNNMLQRAEKVKV